MNIKISIAHFNHQLRNQESDGDENFVRELAEKLKRPSCFGSQDVAGFARASRQSIEMAARECRYRFLQETAAKMGANFIATGHNADDQAETIIQHFLRGSGVAGLAGIKPKSGNLVRPLLFAQRSQIEKFADKNDITYREDSTNSQTIYQRNQIRHELLPHLEIKYNPSLTDTLNRLGENFFELDEYLMNEAQKALKTCIKYKDSSKIILDISKYLAYFTLLQKYVLKAALKEIDLDTGLLDFEKLAQINALLQKKQGGGKIKLNKTIDFVVTFDDIFIGLPEQEIQYLVVNKIPGLYDLKNGWIFEINRVSRPSAGTFLNSSRFEEWIDEEKLDSNLQIRPTNAGDTFFPVNFKGEKKVSDFMIDSKIPVYSRKQIPIIECNKGIVWIGSLRLDDRFKITNSTKNVLHIQLRKAD